jgi:hypothetical protein
VGYLNAILGLGVLALLVVLMVGLNRQAREERQRLERRPAPRQAATSAPRAVREPTPVEEPPAEPATGELAYDAREDGRPDEGEVRPPRRRRRRTGSSGDALEELMDL